MKLKFFATYREITGCRELDIPAPSTAMVLLRELAQIYGAKMQEKLFAADGAVSDEVILLVNGRNIAHLEGTDTGLHDEDVLSLFPMVAGG